MEDKIDKIKRLTLDDIIDNDPIAEGIYDRFITINGVSNNFGRNDEIEDTLKMGLLLIALAADDKHPERDFQKNYIDLVGHSLGQYHSSQYEIDVFMTAAVMLHMCVSLPKNLERFVSAVDIYLNNGFSNMGGYLQTFKRLEQELGESGHYYTIDNLLSMEATEVDITTVDWKEVTKNYDTAAIEDEINKAGSLEKQMEIFEAIEARYNMDHAAAGISDWELRDMKKYFTNLKKLLSIKLKKDDKAKKTASAEADDKLKAENEALKSDNKVLQAHVAKIDAQLTQLDTAVKEEKEKSKAMKTEMEKTVQEYQDLVNSIDAQKEEDGERTRRVTSEALVKLIRKVTPGVKQSTFIDEAKLISYFTNYSVNRIRTDISSSQTFSKKQAAEIDAVNELFANLNIDIKLKYR